MSIQQLIKDFPVVQRMRHLVSQNPTTLALEVAGVTITGATSYTLAQFLVLTIANYANRTILISDIPAAHSSINGILIECNAAGTGWRFIQIPSFTQALMASAGITASVASGWGRIFISDIGQRGSYWYSNGTRFNLDQDSVTLSNLTADLVLTGAPLTSVVAKQILIPKLDGKSIWGDYDLLEVHQVLDKTGANAVFSSVIALGSTSRVIDDAETNTVVNTVASPSAANLNMGILQRLRRNSATAVRVMGGSGTNQTNLATTSGGHSTAIAVPNLDTATTYLDASAFLGSGSDSALTLTTHTVRLISSGAA